MHNNLQKQNKTLQLNMIWKMLKINKKEQIYNKLYLEIYSKQNK